MKWEELTAPEFERAVKDVSGVCLLPIGCLEKHFDHLPLGTDYLIGSDICTLAAQKEPAIVFPPYFIGQIHEARCFPGTLAIDPILCLQLLMNVCDEISRNGLKKIIIVNAHGGNTDMLGYFIQTLLAQRKDYVVHVYSATDRWPENRQKEWREVLQTKIHGHACECETSIGLATFGHLVKMDAIKDRSTQPLNRITHITDQTQARVSNEWYTLYPDHYAGDARSASLEKGLKLRQILVDCLAEYVGRVKRDTTAAELTKEFYDRCDRIGK